jgi:hypothetical protein
LTSAFFLKFFGIFIELEQILPCLQAFNMQVRSYLAMIRISTHLDSVERKARG